MSKKARRRPSWKKSANLRPWKHRRMTGFPWPWKMYHGLDVEEEIAKILIEEINKEFERQGIDQEAQAIEMRGKILDYFHNHTLQKFPIDGQPVHRD